MSSKIVHKHDAELWPFSTRRKIVANLKLDQNFKFEDYEIRNYDIMRMYLIFDNKQLHTSYRNLVHQIKSNKKLQVFNNDIPNKLVFLSFFEVLLQTKASQQQTLPIFRLY